MARLSWAAGVDLGGTKIRVIQVNTSGSIGEAITYLTDVGGGPEAIIREISAAIGELQNRIGSGPEAVGVGVAGQIEAESGIVTFAPNLKWENVPFCRDLKSILGVPVVVTNDVRAATWGEWLHGAGKNANHLLCIFVGTGIGGGIICDGKMLTGYNNTAGEIGHMTVDLDGPLCTCGNFGCAEAFAGGWALAKRACMLVGKNQERGTILLSKALGDPEKITGRHVTEAAAEGDPIAIQILNEGIAALAAATANLINAFSPEKVIFGGGVIEGSPGLLDPLCQLIRLRALDAACKGVKIERAKLHNDAGAIGAGALAIKTFLK